MRPAAAVATFAIALGLVVVIGATEAGAGPCNPGPGFGDARVRVKGADVGVGLDEYSQETGSQVASDVGGPGDISKFLVRVENDSAQKQTVIVTLADFASTNTRLKWLKNGNRVSDKIKFKNVAPGTLVQFNAQVRYLPGLNDSDLAEGDAFGRFKGNAPCTADRVTARGEPE